MTRIILIRHGETIWNQMGRWQGIAPVPLSDTGKTQAERVSHGLSTLGITQIISSDLLRTQQTTTIINKHLNLPISYVKDWREIDVGRWQGLTTGEIEKYDHDAYLMYRDRPFIERAFPEGETRRDQLKRVIIALDNTVATYPDEHALIVTHRGSIQCVLYHLTNSDTHHSENCAITRLRYNKTNWEVIEINTILGRT